MTSKENSPDEELLARYRSASETQVSAPSEAVRAAILAESRRVAAELAKKAPQHPFDASRPAANDSRWKMTAFGTVGVALLAALLFAPRYWERPSIAPARTPAPAAAPSPKLESVAPSSPSEALREAVVPPERKASQANADAGRPYIAPTPSNSPSVVQNYAAAPPPHSPAADSLAAPASQDAAAESAGAVRGGAVSLAESRAARAGSMATPAGLQSAAGLGDVTRTALLLDRGVAVDARDQAGRTPLMLAVAQGRLEVVRLLLQRGADPNAADNMGQTPLQQAQELHLRDIAALLESAGAR
jgi:Ankyrin repeats (3 copies)